MSIVYLVETRNIRDLRLRGTTMNDMFEQYFSSFSATLTTHCTFEKYSEYFSNIYPS